VSDNPIAQSLLVKQLERYNLNVTATNNGEEAIAGLYWRIFEVQGTNSNSHVAWEAHDPGYFSVALFDHRISFLSRYWL
jgi:CheY-like chemotaxis protein